jgi:hypothetical protein
MYSNAMILFLQCNPDKCLINWVMESLVVRARAEVANPSSYNKRLHNPIDKALVLIALEK